MATSSTFLTLINGKPEERSIDSASLIPTSTAVASEALAVNDLVNIFDDAGTVKCRKADASVPYPANGIVKTVYALNDSAVVYTDTEITDTGMTPGATLFLSATTPGAYSETAPAKTNGYINQVVGRNVSDTDIYIEIEQDYVTYNF